MVCIQESIEMMCPIRSRPLSDRPERTTSRCELFFIGNIPHRGQKKIDSTRQFIGFASG